MSDEGGVVLSEGWYIPTRDPPAHWRTPAPRWVLGIINGRVVYSRGGDTHYHCLERTMKRWIRDTGAMRPLPGNGQ